MGMSWNEAKRRYEWTGPVRDLVNAVGSGDARMGFVVDLKSGAKIAMNISGSDDPEATEPFYVESPDGENLYDAGNRREAVKMLSNVRAGRAADDWSVSKPKVARRKASAPKSRSRSRRPSTLLGGMR